MRRSLSKLKPAILAAGLIAFAGLTVAGNSSKPDLVAIAAGDTQLSTLVTALKAADLVSTLQGDGPFTVFAPTDDAFAELPKKVLASLLKPENRDQLQAVLTYHVVPGSFKAAQVLNIGSAQTVNGQSVQFTTRGKGVHVDNANVVLADIDASNGVIHVIDTVILPK